MDRGKEFKVSEKAYAYTPGLKVKRGMKIVKERRLPLLGEILVKEGDRVDYDTIVAKTEVPDDPVLVKASALLGVDQDEVKNFLFKDEGDPVSKDEVIGRYRMFFGLINREVISPINGEIETISELTGQIIIRPKPIPVEVTAYIPGKVLKLLPKEGVIIETEGAFIQGIFGFGGETHGVIRVAVDSPNDMLTVDSISEDDKNRIVVGGSLITLDAYKKAIRVGTAGLVIGGINYLDLINIMGSPLGVAITGEEELGLTLIVTEGFGRMMMSSRTFQLLKRFEGRLAVINGATQIRAGVMRPEIIIPHEVDSEESSSAELATGMVPGTPIRIIREPFFGSIGTVVNLPVNLQEVETGSLVRVLVVRLEDGQEAVVPRANAEIIEE